ncbi:universal stress protein [Actinoplanes sp. NEAU-A12]|uniref:Universal stress protein n=1 Tax=Actinoplanes sandaracinus TaxID=3045177 RepID=A0ABT6WN61_9ACTN|nr:universal stress protein [Actinoplanes sandaracinus]MDI6101167.1 universal stress protein [Actinoplanes sandaracinus]
MQIPPEGPVVVGIGRTPADAAAVRLAAREAVSRGRMLQVVHAFTWHGDTGYPPARRLASHAVQEAVATAQRCTPGVDARGQIVDGPPERVLLRLSRRAVLLVVGGPLTEVLARAWCPVAVTRAHHTPSGPVLAAVDGSPGSLPALRFAAETAARRGGPVHVVHVVTGGPGADGDRVLDEALSCLGGTPAVCRRILAGDPASALVNASRRAGLLALGPRATAPAGRLGTVAEEVLRRSACPAVVVHGRRSAGFRKPGDDTPVLLPLAHT